MNTISMRIHHISFVHAWDGIKTGFKTQPNFKIHLSLSCLVIALGFWYQISSLQWAILLYIIATGLAIELINTAIEYTVDLLTSEYHILAKYAKDTAAGAMLIYAVFSIIIALVIFLPLILS
jgi:undecaprenol kinase